VSDVGRALRAVAWERLTGQLVQAVITVVVLLVLPSPVHSYMPLVAIAVCVAVFGAVLLARARPGGGRSASASVWSGAAADIRDGFLAGGAWLGIVLASALVVCGHASTFLIAARTAGSTAPLSEMLPLALLVMAVMVLPSVAGWGPREGATAWAFAAAGLGAEQGVATAVVYGVIVLAACLPGAAVLAVSWFRRTLRAGQTEPPVARGAAHA
jgi:hypothetical protein